MRHNPASDFPILAASCLRSKHSMHKSGYGMQLKGELIPFASGKFVGKAPQTQITSVALRGLSRWGMMGKKDGKPSQAQTMAVALGTVNEALETVNFRENEHMVCHHCTFRMRDGKTDSTPPEIKHATCGRPPVESQRYYYALKVSLRFGQHHRTLQKHRHSGWAEAWGGGGINAEHLGGGGGAKAE